MNQVFLENLGQRSIGSKWTNFFSGDVEQDRLNFGDFQVK